VNRSGLSCFADVFFVFSINPRYMALQVKDSGGSGC